MLTIKCELFYFVRYIFNRRSHQWDGTTFGFDNVYTKVQEGPILEAAIIVVEAKTGVIKKQFGENMYDYF